MLLTEKMKEDIFSPSERTIITYMFDKLELIRDKTTKQIAEETYTHPSTLIRIAKKLGYNGWIELKDDFLQEMEYVNSHFTDVDANYPFHEHDHLLNIANKMATLHQNTIKDTLSLLKYEDLQKATTLLNHAEEIKIFGINNNLILCHDFKAHMNRIGKRVSICNVDSEFEAASSDVRTVAIIISYSGESLVSHNILPLLQRRKTPIIALTSIGDNTLSKQADCVFRITTREKLYSKIGSFSSNNSIGFLLDVLYSCVFSKDYQKNLAYKIQISERYDHRKSTNKVMEEE
ncbi:MurR/RpiR family transcriptional regulator [Ornithinibacillus halotolerans]|uniref:RpiR family transcriptional regulator n=1 Tax=Ornithinibacillus halotolerans TaxID=1274357 RepID=A0A916SBA1_9BACI|nr:MurR/RpiR family transcriptional regulator [Ornithinibacillus halotolerans]GGA92080.1 RpiR family transcriptional regulator [Ornithinibacillus halotolerans]